MTPVTKKEIKEAAKEIVRTFDQYDYATLKLQTQAAEEIITRHLEWAEEKRPMKQPTEPEREDFDEGIDRERAKLDDWEGRSLNEIRIRQELSNRMEIARRVHNRWTETGKVEVPE